MCVCLFKWICVCVYVLLRVSAWVCVWFCVYVWMRVSAWVWVSVCVFVFMCECAYLLECTYVFPCNMSNYAITCCAPICNIHAQATDQCRRSHLIVRSTTSSSSDHYRSCKLPVTVKWHHKLRQCQTGRAPVTGQPAPPTPPKRTAALVPKGAGYWALLLLVTQARLPCVLRIVWKRWA